MYLFLEGSIDVPAPPGTINNTPGGTIARIKHTPRRKRAQAARLAGRAYEGLRRDRHKGHMQIIPREQRNMKSRDTLCPQKCKKTCQTISDDERETLFKSYWKMGWEQKKVYVCAMINCNTVVRRRPKEKCMHVNRKNMSMHYHFKVNGEMKQVCKGFFLGTLGVNEWSIRNWAIRGSKNNAIHVSPKKKYTRTPPSKINAMNDSLKAFFDLLPKMESHYCRSSTNKTYIQPQFRSLNDLYSAYVKHCKENNVAYSSVTKMKKFFREQNYSLFSPKKDQCDICTSHKTGNINEEEFQKHQKTKTDARKEKELDNEKALTSDDIVVLYVDLQKVLLAPSLQTSACYYKTKLCVHNYTVYDKKTRIATCYIWPETAADLSSNTFCSLIYDYLTTNDRCISAKTIIIYTDGCTYQNRCAQFSNCLLFYTIMFKKQLIHKYLCKGHTQMEVDSVHSVIERICTNRNIYTPTCYINLIENAKKHNPKYKVRYLDYTFFSNFKQFNFYMSIRPGRGVGDACVTDICQLKYESDITYKINHDDATWSALPQRINNIKIDENTHVEKMYQHSIPIKRSKWTDLQNLKSVIPKDYHAYYDSLSFN